MGARVVRAEGGACRVDLTALVFLRACERRAGAHNKYLVLPSLLPTPPTTSDKPNMRSALVYGALLAVGVALARAAPTATHAAHTATSKSSSTSKHVHHTNSSAAAHKTGPYSVVASLLDGLKKRGEFLSLLHSMRKNKNAEIPEAQKNQTRRAQNAQMQKLLGDELYTKYRQIRVANTAAAKAKGGGGGGGGTGASAHQHPAKTPASSASKKKPTGAAAAPTASTTCGCATRCTNLCMRLDLYIL